MPVLHINCFLNKKMLKKILYIPKSIRVLLYLSVFLITMSIVFWRTMTFSFMYWNIFLAMVPFFISSFVLCIFDSFRVSKYLLILLVIVWLIFLPNAFYIVTDLVHVGRIKAVPEFFDIILVFSGALVGILFGITSVFNIEKALLKIWSLKIVKYVIGIIFLFLSFGVYLGRFLRFNSWDIVTDAQLFLKTLKVLFLSPVSSSTAITYTILFFLLFYALYFTFKNFKLE